MDLRVDRPYLSLPVDFSGKVRQLRAGPLPTTELRQQSLEHFIVDQLHLALSPLGHLLEALHHLLETLLGRRRTGGTGLASCRTRRGSALTSWCGLSGRARLLGLPASSNGYEDERSDDQGARHECLQEDECANLSTE